MSQPLPTKNENPIVLDYAVRCIDGRLREPSRSAVIAALRARDEIGRVRHGTSLQAHNGRDAMRDLTEEILDAVMYAVQRGVETTDDAKGDVTRDASLASNEYNLVIDVLNAIVPLLPRLLDFCAEKETA